jgi:hypothetical protein
VVVIQGLLRESLLAGIISLARQSRYWTMVLAIPWYQVLTGHGLLKPNQNTAFAHVRDIAAPGRGKDPKRQTTGNALPYADALDRTQPLRDTARGDTNRSSIG